MQRRLGRSLAAPGRHNTKSFGRTRRPPSVLASRPRDRSVSFELSLDPLKIPRHRIVDYKCLNVKTILQTCLFLELESGVDFLYYTKIYYIMITLDFRSWFICTV